MSPHKYPIVSGKQLVNALVKIGYKIVHQKGSHIKLRKFYDSEKHTIVITNHKKIDRGTLGSIIKKMTKFMSEKEFLNILE